MRPLRILLLGTQMATGGAQKMLLDQARWFDEHGQRVTIAFFYDRDGLFDTWSHSFNFPLYDLHAFDRKAAFFPRAMLFVGGIGRLWALLRRGKFDVVITHTHDSNMLGLPLAWIAGVPVRIGTHLGVIRGIPGWRVRLHAMLVNIGCMQTLIAASKGTEQNAIREGVSPARIQIIPNGAHVFDVDLTHRDEVRRTLGVDENDVLILCVGRLVYEKGHEFLIRAMPQVVKEFPNAKAAICGSGPLQEFLASLIAVNALGRHVNLLGQWNDIPRLLAAADIFVLPSRWEGLSIALLEGMLAKLPVVTTRVEGVEEVIEDNVSGLLVPLEDSEALAKAILQLLRDPGKGAAMGIAGRARVLQGYTTDSMCEQYMKVIENHLEHRVV